MKDLTENGFSKFTGARTFLTEDLIVSIGEKGRIGINKRAFLDYLSHYQFVELFYNSKTKVMALKGTNTKNATAFPIKNYEKVGTAYINSKSFFNFFGIKPEKKRIKAIWDKEAEALLVQL